MTEQPFIQDNLSQPGPESCWDWQGGSPRGWYKNSGGLRYFGP